MVAPNEPVPSASVAGLGSARRHARQPAQRRTIHRPAHAGGQRPAPPKTPPPTASSAATSPARRGPGAFR